MVAFVVPTTARIVLSTPTNSPRPLRMVNTPTINLCGCLFWRSGYLIFILRMSGGQLPSYPPLTSGMRLVFQLINTFPLLWYPLWRPQQFKSAPMQHTCNFWSAAWTSDRTPTNFLSSWKDWRLFPILSIAPFGTVELNAKVQVMHRLILVITKCMLQSLEDSSRHGIGRVACKLREWVGSIPSNVGW
jgi:hypothetical protein